MPYETLQEVLRRQVAQKGHAPAFVSGQRVTSFMDLQTRSESAAKASICAGVRPGARIGYLGKNHDRFFELLFAAAYAGAVMVPIGWRLTVPEVAFQLVDSNIELLFVHPESRLVAETVAAGLERVRLVSTEEAFGAVPAYDAYLSKVSGVEKSFPPTQATDAVLQLYTSGTTGHPKGAMLSHANLFALRPRCAAAGLGWDRWEEGDVSLVTMPVAHVSGALWGLVGVYNGIKSIILPEFDAGAVIRIVSAEPISKIFLVPTAIQAVLRHADMEIADFSRVRHILYGASPISLELLREAVAVFGCGFVQNYGMTETSGTIAVLPPEDHDPQGNARMRSAGRALPGVDLKIVDAALNLLPTGEIGEILVRSATVMLGYWGRPEATAEALVDGWMRTGDAGYLDPDGYLFVRDRLKDMIITGGENVYPAEVEAVLLEYPGVVDVAVIGIPDERWGEAVTAIVVWGERDLHDHDILRWGRERLATYKIPKRVFAIDSLPRNVSGKLLRRILREKYSIDGTETRPESVQAAKG